MGKTGTILEVVTSKIVEGGQEEMKCDECSELLDLYIAGDLSPEKMQEIGEHLSSCQQCREELAFAKKMQKEMPKMPKPRLPENFKAEVMQKIHEEKRQEKKAVIFSYLRMRRVAPVLAAALLVGVFLKVDMLKLSKDSVGMQDEQIVMSTPTLSPEETEIPAATETAPEEVAETVPEEVQPAETQAPAVTPSQAPKRTATPAPRQTSAPAATARTKQAEKSAPTAVPSREEAPMAKSAGGAEDSEVQSFSVSAAVDSADAGTASAGAARNKSTFDTSGFSVGSVAVNQDQLSDAKSIAGKYGDYKNRVYEMSKSEMNQFLNELDQNGISYQNRAGNQSNVRFKIVGE